MSNKTKKNKFIEEKNNESRAHVNPGGKGGRNNATKNRFGRFENKGDSKDRAYKTEDNPDFAAHGMTGTKADNPPDWWANNPKLLEAAAKIPFVIQPGMLLPTLSTMAAGETKHLYPRSKLGAVMSLGFYPSIGNSTDSQSPASIIAREMYARIRKAYSGSKLDADPADLFMYCMGMDSIHMFIAYLKRIYGLINEFRYDNRLVPDTIIRSMGLTPALYVDLREHLTDFWGNINLMANKANSMLLPNDMDIYARHQWMCERVYKDVDDSKAQLYVFNPLGFYQINEELDPTLGTSLECKTLNIVSRLRYQDLMQFGWDLIDAMFNWHDAFTINGYFLRAYSESTPFVSPEIPQDYSTEIVYSAEVLMEIENFSPVQTTGASRNITQRPDKMDNAIICDIVAQNVDMVDQNIINLHFNNPTAADIALATRFMPSIVYASNNIPHVYCGTELPAKIEIFEPYEFVFGELQTGVTMPEVLTAYRKTLRSQMTSSQGSTLMTLAQNLTFLGNLSIFAHAPIMFHEFFKSDPDIALLTIHGDLYNVSSISDEDLQNLHRICMYSIMKAFPKGEVT